MIQISPKAFFFDFDGVLYDTEHAHMHATQNILKKYGITFTEDYYFEKLFGFDDVALIEHLFQINHKPLNKGLLHKLMREKNIEILHRIQHELSHIDGVLELIHKLEQKNIPMAIVSGALKNEVEACLIKSDLRKYFKFIICADMVSTSKPHPESYTMAFEYMNKIIPNLTFNDCWVLEDSPTGLASAKGAHLNTIGITNTTSSENLELADLIVDDYSEIEIL